MVTCEKSLDLNNSGKAAKSLYAFGGDVLTNEVKIKYPNGIKKFGEFASITAVKSNLNCQDVYLTSIPATEKKSQTVSMHLYISNIIALLNWFRYVRKTGRSINKITNRVLHP